MWLTCSHTIQEVINGFEAAWQYFSGIFPVVIREKGRGTFSKITTLKVPSKKPQAASKPAITASVLWRKLSQTKQCRSSRR
jgi:hypothetical protein